MTRWLRVSKTSSPTANLGKTLLQTAVFWTAFLWVLPAAIHALERRFGIPPISIPWHTPIAAVGFIVSSALGVWSGVTMALAGRGTPLPLDAASELVVKGPYRWVRNPMAVAGLAQGMFVGLARESVSVWAYVIAGGLLWNRIVRPMEERDLHERFGRAYDDYAQRVRCWVPRRPHPIPTATLPGMPSQGYVYQPQIRDISFESALAQMRAEHPGRRIETGYVPFNTRASCGEVLRRMQAHGLKVMRFDASSAQLAVYLRRADYATRFPEYYAGMQKEKTFEHFVAMRLLELTEGDVFLDLASEGSPLPEIAARLSGCRALAQDIMYPPGIRDGKMGGDACAMPVGADFASAAALTCSLEHFEGDADTRLFAELARVLRPGGRVVVVPTYLFTHAATQTDPRYSVSAEVQFDEGVPLYCAEGWGNRHGRFYSPETLVERIVAPLRQSFAFTLYEIAAPFVTDYDDTSIYARFALLAVRLGTPSPH